MLDNEDGTYTVQYEASSAGNYSVNIMLHGKALAPCPYKVVVTEDKPKKEPPKREKPSNNKRLPSRTPSRSPDRQPKSRPSKRGSGMSTECTGHMPSNEVEGVS